MYKRKPEGISPEGVEELIQDVVKDKVVCDVGCGSGDFMERLRAAGAGKVIGIEEEEEWAREAAERGFDVLLTNHWFQPLPEADVYYLWTKDAMGVYLKAQYDGTKGTFVFGHTVRPSLSTFLKTLDGEWRTLPNTDWKVFITTL